MKKILNFFPVLLCLIVAGSCKKEGKTGLGPEDHSVHYAYYKGVVQDSITGIPIPNIYAFSQRYDTADVNGMYLHYYRWEGRPGFGGYTRFADGTPMGVAAGGAGYYGEISFTAGQLIENDTILIPPVKANLIGYIKIHVKDTSGVVMNMELKKVLVRYVRANWNLHFPGNIDTVITYGAVADRNVLVDWSYTNTSAILIHPTPLSVFISAGDTSSVDVFY